MKLGKTEKEQEIIFYFLENRHMNIETFASLKALMNNLECKSEEASPAVSEIKITCQEALHLIDTLRFQNESEHIQLAMKQAYQYINKALYEIETYSNSYNPFINNSKMNIMDICGPAHASLEIILNLNRPLEAA